MSAVRGKSGGYVGAMILGLALAGPVSADRYRFDKIHTQVIFFVDHLGFSKSQGEFHDYDGTFVFDPADWPGSSVEVSIRTASLDMDDPEWDNHLRGKDFFDVGRFPDMRFRSTRVERTGEHEGRVEGELTLLGVTRPVTLDIRFNKAAVHPKTGQYVAGFSGHATVKRSDFGMTYGLPFVGDDVEVRLEVEGLREAE